MIKPTVQLRGNFKVTAALRAALAKARGSHVEVGIQKDAGSYAPTRRQPNPPTVAQVALWMEYGTRYAPARPFLGPAIDENQDVLSSAMAKGLAGIALHGWSVDKGLSAVGLAALILVQNRVLSNVGPALSGQWDPPQGYLGEKRIRGMGQRTLVATGLLYRSLTYKVHLAGGASAPSHSNGHPGPEVQDDPEALAAGRAKARAQAKLDKAQQRAQRKAFDRASWVGRRTDGSRVKLDDKGHAVRTPKPKG